MKPQNHQRLNYFQLKLASRLGQQSSRRGAMSAVWRSKRINTSNLRKQLEISKPQSSRSFATAATTTPVIISELITQVLSQQFDQIASFGTLQIFGDLLKISKVGDC